MTLAEFTAECGKHIAQARHWFGHRTQVIDDRFRAIIYGIEYPLEIVGVDVPNRKFVARALKTEAAVESGRLVFFDETSMGLLPPV